MMRTARRRTTSGVACFVLAVLVSGCTSSASGSGAPDKGYLPGDGTIAKVSLAERGAPVSFRGTTLQGKPFDLSSTRGKVVVVNVWGSWCSPCAQEAPALQEVWSQQDPSKVAFIGIDTRDQNKAALAHERRFGVTYPSIDDDQSRVLLRLRGKLPPTAIPSTLVLDRRGRVAYRVLSAVRASTLQGLIEDTLAERTSAAAG